jgi:hypothetical protein
LLSLFFIEGERWQTIETSAPMKIACAGGALAREIERGGLTQLEFVDLCARECACDGIVLDARQFPRTDDDYLAQLKKMAVDWGLSIAGLWDAAFLRASSEAMLETLRLAVVLGSPLVAAPLASETESAWGGQLERLGIATSLAKQLNVTIALRNAPATFAATTHDCKRVAKETDSAWLRFGPEPSSFDTASDAATLAADSVLLWSPIGESDDSIAETVAAFSDFRGFVAVDDATGSASPGAIAAAVTRWRDGLEGARKELNRR